MKRLYISMATLLLLAGCTGNTPEASPAEMIPPAETAATESTEAETTGAESAPATTENTTTEKTAAETTGNTEATEGSAGTTAREKNTSAGTEDTTAPAETEAPPATTAPKTEESAGWRNAYTEVLRESTAKKFSLCYVDEDDIPELILHETAENLADTRDILVYTYMDEEAVLLAEEAGDGGFSRFTYVPYQNRITESDNNGNHRVTFLYTLRDGAYCVEHMLSADDDAKTYTADGQALAEDAYRKMLEDWTAGSVADRGDWDVTEENIAQYVAW